MAVVSAASATGALRAPLAEAGPTDGLVGSGCWWDVLAWVACASMSRRTSVNMPLRSVVRSVGGVGVLAAALHNVSVEGVS